MRIRVVPFADLRRQFHLGSGESLALDIHVGSTVGDLLEQLAIQPPDQLIIGIDGEYATLDSPLHDGAELVLVTPMEGG
ncbi:MAG: MoaD/ThiS family protein [Chloroflexota bacterium]